jgi:uncharacterized protein (TIGR00288 family)
MNQRPTRHAPPRGPVTPIYRGPQAVSAAQQNPFQHAPNAALLIDFDNVTMGIRSDLAGELRNLLSSEIIKGKVAVQRAYADWRRYPQYIVPLAEASIDMIMAPAYGSSKKNATDIRLAVDAVELVFTRPEIGTYILLSGDSDFASMVTKLKEYGKYVIGVGIRESSSDLLVMNCDEYYSYNALAGLVKSSEDEVVKWDPYELVVEAINRMVKNGDVMRSDRLKQVMQDIDPQFDEKNVGMSKFSKFCTEAASQGLLKVTKLENGQLEVAPGEQAVRAGSGGAPAPRGPSQTQRVAENGDRDERGRRGRRGGRGRGGREERREERPREAAATREERPREDKPRDEKPREEKPREVTARDGDQIGKSGERLTRDEAFDLIKRAAGTLIKGDGAVSASTIRKRAYELLERDSESLSARFFDRVLRDAHDSHVIDLRRRGDDFDVALPSEVAPVAEQLNRASQARVPATTAPAAGSAAVRGMGPRGIPARGRGGRGKPPADLLSVGVVDHGPAVAAAEPPAAVPSAEAEEAAPKAAKGSGRGAKKATAKKKTKVAASAEPAVDAGAAAAKTSKKRAPRKKKSAAATEA